MAYIFRFIYKFFSFILLFIPKLSRKILYNTYTPVKKLIKRERNVFPLFTVKDIQFLRSFMNNTISKRIISLFLFLTMLFSASLTLIGCSAEKDDTSHAGSQSSDTDSTGESNNGSASVGTAPSEEESEEDDGWRDRIIFFEKKDYERDTEDFDSIEYVRPDFDSVFARTEAAISVIEKNELPFDGQIASINSIEDGYTNAMTMRAIANVHVAKDSSNEFWAGELSYIGSKTPLLLELIDDLYVAAARSPHAEAFEREYFGEGLIEKYKNGGTYSDNAIELLKKEEELENAYTTLSTASVEVTYEGVTDTVDNILGGYLQKYENARNDAERAVYLTRYAIASKKCKTLYEIQSKQILTELFVELVRVRRRIANELGHKSYAEYAYEQHDRDYSYEDASKFIDDLSEYILPVYYILSFTSLGQYLSSGAPLPREISLDELINNSYSALNGTDEEFGDIYRYMLQHKLYDVDHARTNRNNGSFVTYLKDYNAPFVFISASGDISDYATLMHEFGHFTDAFLNYDSPTSIDQSEISSQALEYLMLTRLGTVLDGSDMKYLIETSMLNALTTLILQGFYAKAEQLIYELPLERITREELDKQVLLAAEAFSLNTNYFSDITSIFMTHTFVYPFYVQSYCTSLIPALEIFFMELEEEGSGFAAYRELIDRTDESVTLEHSLKNAGLSSPFDDGIVKETAIKIRDYLLSESSSPENGLRIDKTA